MNRKVLIANVIAVFFLFGFVFQPWGLDSEAITTLPFSHRLAVLAVFSVSLRRVRKQPRGHLGSVSQSCFATSLACRMMGTLTPSLIYCLDGSLHGPPCETSNVTESSPRSPCLLLASYAFVRILSSLPSRHDWGHGSLQSIDGETKKKKATQESQVV